MANAQMIHDAQQFLAGESVPGWLIYDYLGCNPVLAQVAPASGHVTRPVFPLRAGRRLAHPADAPRGRRQVCRFGRRNRRV